MLTHKKRFISQWNLKFIYYRGHTAKYIYILSRNSDFSKPLKYFEYDEVSKLAYNELFSLFKCLNIFEHLIIYSLILNYPHDKLNNSIL